MTGKATLPGLLLLGVGGTGCSAGFGLLLFAVIAIGYWAWHREIDKSLEIAALRSKIVRYVDSSPVPRSGSLDDLLRAGILNPHDMEVAKKYRLQYVRFAAGAPGRTVVLETPRRTAWNSISRTAAWGSCGSSLPRTGACG